MIKVILDLDGTITSQETLPLIANHFGIQEKIDELTKETIQGNIPYVESFIRRVPILGKLPVDQVSTLLEKVSLYPELLSFVRQHREHCIIATGNLECWVEKLLGKIGCEYQTSESLVEDNQVVKLTKILRKEMVVEKEKANGHQVVFVGDGNNDLEAMRIADISIAVGMTHFPSRSLFSVARYLIFSERALCRQLNQLF